jgi:ribulose-5-phosphate 4-epimerase/fuculose-1-phosphate aldolase
VRIYPRAILIHTPDLGQELATALGDGQSCLLQGHGIVTVGATVAEATVRAIKLESLAELTVQASTTGREPKLVAEADVASIMGSWEQAKPTYFRWVWAFYRRKLGLDDSAKGN